MLIHLEKLGKSFGEKVVLHDVTASVEREDRIGIVGQNGAGKTTLLKILTGEYQDYDGEFSVTHGVTLGYLEQNAKLDPTLDIYGEIISALPVSLQFSPRFYPTEVEFDIRVEPNVKAKIGETRLHENDLRQIIDGTEIILPVKLEKYFPGSGFTPDQKIVIALRLVKRGGLKLNL